MRLCVFPNDPILAYYDKGEIKERYFNPENIFKEIHIISLTDKEIGESEVKTIAGNATLKIHAVGKINIKNRSSNTDRIKTLVKTINPDVIRAYNPLLAGWFAAKCSTELKIPMYLSLHTQYDHLRNLNKKHNFKKYLTLKYTEKFIEPFVLKNAERITMVYSIIEPYVRKHGGKKPELLYNKIDYNRFSEAIARNDLPKPLIISVGRLIEPKYHQCLIKSMKDVDAHLLIIGNGILYEKLSQLIIEMNLQNKITIKKAVPNSEIQNYYKAAQVFALAYDPELEGLPIPVMEAMASGLPVVIPFPKDGYSDGLEDIAIFSERTPESFSRHINEVLANSKLHEKLSSRSLSKAKEFDSEVIEKREAQIYFELLKKSDDLGPMKIP